jgi:hypothetical protein
VNNQLKEVEVAAGDLVECSMTAEGGEAVHRITLYPGTKQARTFRLPWYIHPQGGKWTQVRDEATGEDFLLRFP